MMMVYHQTAALEEIFLPRWLLSFRGVTAVRRSFPAVTRCKLWTGVAYDSSERRNHLPSRLLLRDARVTMVPFRLRRFLNEIVMNEIHVLHCRTNKRDAGAASRE